MASSANKHICARAALAMRIALSTAAKFSASSQYIGICAMAMRGLFLVCIRVCR
jgi:ABC-type microcin C transport system permease subunit YejE